MLDRRLIFVTGKGGTGKTTIAAGLAWLLASSGRRVLACEVDAKGDLAAAFEAGTVGFDPVQVPGGPWVMSMDTEASLREYLRLHLKVPVIGRIGPLAAAFDFVATAAPGVREILTVGKLCYEVREQHYDTVVVDAVATGHVLSQLTAPDAINGLVKVGLIRSQTGWMLDILNDAATTGVVVVTTPEDMPVVETLALVESLRTTTHVDVAGVIVNRMLPELFGVRDEATFATVAAARPGALREPRFDGVFDAARHATARRRLGAEHVATLRERLAGGPPVAFQPYLSLVPQGLRATRQVADSLGGEPRDHAPVAAAPHRAARDHLVLRPGRRRQDDHRGVGRHAGRDVGTRDRSSSPSSTRMLPRRRARPEGDRQRRDEDRRRRRSRRPASTRAASCMARCSTWKQSWDDLIVRHAPDERHPPTRNPGESALSEHHREVRPVPRCTSRWSGSWSCTRRGSGTCIVVDTPPTRNALDFLDAPARIADFSRHGGCGGRSRRPAVGSGFAA